MSVLYRKYRPRTFAEVAGQEPIKAALAHEAATGRVAHSYLFSGPRGVGKTSLARIFAKAINCASRNAQGDPCGTCATCTEIAEGRSLDVIEIDAASHTGVDNVREEIIERARFAPAALPYKVFIIDEVHMLSTSAFNALLKTLEEPPARVVFILATTELHKLPATVVSRCQRFDFRKIAPATLEERLGRLARDEGAAVDADVLQAIARLSEGCLRDAESLLGQLLALGEKTITAETAALVLPVVSSQASSELLESLLARDAAAALGQWERLLAAGADPLRLVSVLTEGCRETMLRLVKGEDTGKLAVPEIAELLNRLIKAGAEMKRVDPPELAFELLLAEWSVSKAEVRVPPQEPPQSTVKPSAPAAPPAEAISLAQVTAPESVPTPGERSLASATVQSGELGSVKEQWSAVLAAAQKRNHGLPYMLGVAELLECKDGHLTIGFQYAMYRDRLNERRHREVLEEALAEVVGTPLRIKAVLVAQRTDGLVEPAPQVRVDASAALPDGFAELVKEFGGTVA